MPLEILNDAERRTLEVHRQPGPQSWTPAQHAAPPSRPEIDADAVEPALP